jgi:PAS domain S-box-containing protein
MIEEQLQDEAAAFAAGVMPADERETFEMLLTYHGELRELVNGLLDTATDTALAASAPVAAPAGLKAAILTAIAARPQQREHEAIVVAGPDALVEWVSPEFTALCGYSLEEVRGRRLGPILQGELTEKDAAAAMRAAVRGATPCRTVMTNYRKDGSHYQVDIDLRPIFKDDGTLRCYVAREVALAA